MAKISNGVLFTNYLPKWVCFEIIYSVDLFFLLQNASPKDAFPVKLTRGRLWTRPAYRCDGSCWGPRRDARGRLWTRPTYRRDGTRPAYKRDGSCWGPRRDARGRLWTRPAYRRDGTRPAYRRDGSCWGTRRDGSRWDPSATQLDHTSFNIFYILYIVFI